MSALDDVKNRADGNFTRIDLVILWVDDDGTKEAHDAARYAAAEQARLYNRIKELEAEKALLNTEMTCGHLARYKAFKYSSEYCTLCSLEQAGATIEHLAFMSKDK